MRILIFVAFAALVVGVSAALATPSVPASNALTFDVIRKGKDIGDYTIRFQPSGNALTVRLKTDVAVKVLGITAYSFTQDSTEHWTGGKLTALSSVTDDDGEQHSIKLGASAILPASLWNAAIVKATKAINTIDGRKMNIRVTRIGAEKVKTGHGTVAATHYRLSGDLARDLWYDADGVLVKVAFVGDDGSKVEYRLR